MQLFCLSNGAKVDPAAPRLTSESGSAHPEIDFFIATTVETARVAGRYVWTFDCINTDREGLNLLYEY
jgi:hypothetical protein